MWVSESECEFNIPISKVSFNSTASLGSLQLPALTGWIGRKQAMMTATAMTTERHVKVLLDSPRLRIRNWSNEDGGDGNGDDSDGGGGGGGSSIFIIVHLWPKNWPRHTLYLSRTHTPYKLSNSTSHRDLSCSFTCSQHTHSVTMFTAHFIYK